jgi:hypothetical protein
MTPKELLSLVHQSKKVDFKICLILKIKKIDFALINSKKGEKRNKDC